MGAGPCALTFVCEPSHFREIDHHFSTASYTNEGVSVQIITAAVLCEGDTILGSASLAPVSNNSEAPPRGGGVPHPARPTVAQEGTQQPSKKSLRCSSCEIDFDDASDYRLHCRSDWHNFNLKRKVKALPCVSQEEFAEISLDVRE